MKLMHALPAVAICLLACGSSSDDGPSPKPSAGAVFVTDSEPSGTRVVLTEKEVTRDALVLELRAHEVADLYGVAARISVDPAALAFERMTLGPAFTQMTRTINLAKPGAEPGQLVLALSGHGTQSTASANDVVLARLHFKRASADATSAVRFTEHRSGVVDGAGRKAAGTTFVGGELRVK